MAKLILLALMGTASLGFATTTITSITGASAASQATGTTTDGSWDVYGGIQKTAKPLSDFNCAGNGTCNTCVGGAAQTDSGTTPPKHYPCNQNGVFAASTVLSFQANTTVTGTNLKWLLCETMDEVKASADFSTHVSLTWTELCGKFSSANCETDLSKTLIYGAAADCTALNSSSDKVTVRIKTRVIDLDVVSDYDGSCATPGACLFSLFPGDGKAFLEEETNFTQSAGSSGIQYNAAVFFYTEASGNDDSVSFSNVITSGNFRTEAVPLTTEGFDGSFIGGLTNDVKYCFKMGSRDQAGNIDHISSIDCTVADCETTIPRVCITPSEVVGMLSDKQCFIATAAFGSSLDQHVQMMREFRNQFLAPHWIGRKFVKAYYKVSPPLAKWISGHEGARTVARWGLYPLMTWAKLSLQFGWWMFFAPFAGLAIAVVLFVRRRSA